MPQVELLYSEGFNVTHWKTVENLRKIEEGDYDIIFLDIAGVGENNSREGAVGILKSIKEYNPSIAVVAFSGQKFNIEQTKFFQMADDVLNKEKKGTGCLYF